MGSHVTTPVLTVLTGAIDTQDEVQIKHIRRAYASSSLQVE